MKSVNTGILTNYDLIQEPSIPFMHEVWNWEGDKSVLPSKWINILEKARGSSISKAELLQNYVETKGFDTNGFFFLTKRSKAIGTAFAYRCENYYSIMFLSTYAKERKVLIY